MEEIKSNVKPRRKHPLDNADIISWLLFFWLLPFFKEGYKKELTEDDIFEHRKSHDSGQLGDKLEATWNKLSANNKKPSLIKAIIQTFFLEALLLNCLIFTEEMIRISQPFFITKLILVYENNRANEDKSEIYIYAALIVITSYISNNMAHNFNLAIMQLAIKIRVSCCSLIYRKALRNIEKPKGKNITVINDLCPQDREEQKVLIKYLKIARSKKLEAKIVDFKLIIENRVYTTKELSNVQNFEDLDPRNYCGISNEESRRRSKNLNNSSNSRSTTNAQLVKERSIFSPPV
ncbi:unnamed protein product [Psylliodes chrysocephalus]|uniref:Uncharacterized protein n=1 Tax=Psylliodes chrysocephalus TaxID=3402493 RepID=A0A9P0GCU2_9CUCU|nr:unnamed protein product [Psylliodes chrysocephala]